MKKFTVFFVSLILFAILFATNGWSAAVEDCFVAGTGSVWSNPRALPSTTLPQSLTCADPDPQNDTSTGEPACKDNWGLDRIDQRGNNRDQTYVFDRAGRTAATTVHIYVMDTGILASHDEFKDSSGLSRVVGGAYVSGTTVNPGSTTNTDDCYGHGTHVAGIIAGRTYGVAKDAILHPVRIGCGISDATTVATALDWIADNAVLPAVVNWSGGNDTTTYNSVVVRTAVQKLLAKGIVLVQSAGNQSHDYDPTHPTTSVKDACNLSFGGLYPDVVVAGGVDESNGRWVRQSTDPGAQMYCDPFNSQHQDCGSNVGSCIDVWAPASHVLSSSMKGSSRACLLSGTSMSAAFVTGTVALYLQDHPRATPAQVNIALRSLGSWGKLLNSSGHSIVSPSSANVLLDSRASTTGTLNTTGLPSLLWRNPTTGLNAAWLMKATQAETSYISTMNLQGLSNPVNEEFRAETVADFNSDGIQDILWHHNPAGESAIWLMKEDVNGNAIFGSVVDLPTTPLRFQGAADMDGNGKPDIILRDGSTGDNYVWMMNGASYGSTVQLTPLPNTQYAIAGVADFDGDGHPDILWRNATTGANAIWRMNGTNYLGTVDLPGIPNPDYHVGAVLDLNADGSPDIVWRNTVTGANAVWIMNGTVFSQTVINLPGVTSPWDMAGPR